MIAYTGRIRHPSERIATCRCGTSFVTQRRTQRFCSHRCGALAQAPKAPNRTSFRPGQAPWNAGMVGYLFGHPVSPETRAKMSATKLARPGLRISPPNEAARKTREYRAWRTAVFERDDYTCQSCGQRGGRLHADHILRFADHPELRCDLANGRTLCIPCHRVTETYGRRSERLDG